MVSGIEPDLDTVIRFAVIICMAVVSVVWLLSALVGDGTTQKHEERRK